MAAIEFNLDDLFVEMTDEEVREVFPTIQKRSAQFPEFQRKLNSLKVGSEWTVNLPPGADPEKAARELRYNVNEAAKERKTLQKVALTDEEAQQYNANRKIDRFEREDGSVIMRTKDGWMAEVSEPVILTWRTITRDEERVVDGEKKTVKVPVRMHIVVRATEAIRHRQRNKPETTETADANGHVAQEPVANGSSPQPEPVAA